MLQNLHFYELPLINMVCLSFFVTFQVHEQRGFVVQSLRRGGPPLGAAGPGGRHPPPPGRLRARHPGVFRGEWPTLLPTLSHVAVMSWSRTLGKKRKC